MGACGPASAGLGGAAPDPVIIATGFTVGPVLEIGRGGRHRREVVVRWRTASLADDGNVPNAAVQDQCLRWPGHLGLIVGGAVADGVRAALRHERVRMNCWAL